MSYQIITETEQLNDFCLQISETSSWIAIDTEFVRTDTYFPELSLIQIQGHDGLLALIDPLAIKDLDGLWELLSNPAIVKVFHAARQDLEILYQLGGQLPSPIFDTQIAAVFLKYGASAGLATVIKGELKFDLPKDQTRTNWHQRPLTPQQIEYALNDVRYLAKLYDVMLPQLNPQQLAALEEDFAELLNLQHYQLQPDKAGEKIKASQKMGPKAKAICYRLAEWRETYAIDHNKPKHWSLSDDAIIAMAKRPPKDIKALHKVPNIKISSIKQFGVEWIALIDDVFAHPELWPEKTPKPAVADAHEEVLLSLAQAICQQISIKYNINVNQIANKTHMLNVIRHPDEKQMSGWRHLLLEQPLKSFLRCETSLKIMDNEVIIN